MRPIKFRGISRGIRYPKGKTFPKDQSHCGFYDGGWSMDAPNIFFEDEHGWNFVPVNPDTVAQLVGYDIAGNEVYEGDIVVSELGNEFVAELRPMVTQKTPLGENVNLDIYKFKLKGEKGNGRRENLGSRE